MNIPAMIIVIVFTLFMMLLGSVHRHAPGEEARREHAERISNGEDPLVVAIEEYNEKKNDSLGGMFKKIGSSKGGLYSPPRGTAPGANSPYSGANPSAGGVLPYVEQKNFQNNIFNPNNQATGGIPGAPKGAVAQNQQQKFPEDNGYYPPRPMDPKLPASPLQDPNLTTQSR